MVRRELAADLEEILTDIVVVPLWKRAEFAEACLSRLTKAMDGDVRVRFCLDTGFSPDVQLAARQFSSKHQGTSTTIQTEDYPTGSYNVFTGLREALEGSESGDRIHILEEDIFIAHDYFTFHRGAHAAAPDAYSVSACQNLFLTRETKPSPIQDAVYRSGAYQVWGSSYRPEVVEQILSRVKPDYFTDMGGAFEREFSPDRDHVTGSLYDGVMAMNMSQIGGYTAFPFAPRAYHAGFEGVSYKGKGPALKGTPKQRAKMILAMTEKELEARSDFPNAWFPVVDLDAHRQPVTRMLSF